MPVVGTRKLILKLGGNDYTDSVSSVTIDSGEKDSDFMSFAEALAGGARDYTLKLTLRQDTAAASLWYYIWAQAGTDVAVSIWPNGGSSRSTTTPEITGTVTVREPDGTLFGGEANRSATAVQVTEVEWVYTAKPTLNVA